MFCYKCGSELPDKAKFCHKCGAKLIGEEMQQQAIASTHSEPIQQMQQKPQAVTLNMPKKEKYIFITIGVIVVFLFIVIIISMSGDSEMPSDSADYLKTNTNKAEEDAFEYSDHTGTIKTDNNFDDYEDEIFGYEGEDEIFGYEGEDEVYAYNLALDEALCGRWRSADGGVIELYDTGYAQTSLDLCPWWAIGKSTALSWEASNGQLNLITSYAAEYDYEYYPKDWGDEYYADHLRVGSLTLHRVNGNTGDSMIGVWDDNDIGGPYFTFNEDGTGAFANDKYITWEADAENVYIYYDLYSTFDYSVEGDILTIFFSDGSDIYTRVGY